MSAKKSSLFDSLILGSSSGKGRRTTVVHCSRSTYDVLIDRTTKWGNPYLIGQDGTREEVIEKYHQWIVTQTTLMDSLHELKGKRLGCWCHPKPCHGWVLVDLIRDRFGMDS